LAATIQIVKLYSQFTALEPTTPFLFGGGGQHFTHYAVAKLDCMQQLLPCSYNVSPLALWIQFWVGRGSSRGGPRISGLCLSTVSTNGS